MTELDVLRQRLKDGPPLPVLCSGIHTESRRACLQSAERLVFLGCVHEHISGHFVCAGHDEVSDMGCSACWASGHECPLGEITNPGVDVEAWLLESICPSDPSGIDMAEWRDFVREHLHDLVPGHLRTTS